MNIESIISYLWFLYQTRGLQWALVRVRTVEISGRLQVGRAGIDSKH
jgi:hypothetical protein